MQFDVKIRKVIENGKPLKAVASVTVDGAFVIHKQSNDGSQKHSY